MTRRAFPAVLLVGLALALSLPACQRSDADAVVADAVDRAGGAEADAGADEAGAGEPPAATAADGHRLLPLPAAPTVLRIATGQVHGVEIPLEEGQYLLASAEQQGADVLLTLYGPDGDEVLWVDRPTENRGLERLPWIARRSGPHRLEVTVYEEPGRGWGGQYELTVEVQPRPDDRAERFLAATAALSRAVEHRDGGRQAEAEASFREAAAGFESLGETELEVESLDHLGAHLTRSTDEAAQGRALEVWRRAEELYRRMEIPLDVARALNFQATSLEKSGRRREAEERFLDVIDYAREQGLPDEESAAHHNLGELLSEQGEAERAVDHLEQAVELAREKGETASLAMSLRLLGYEYLLLGMPRRAVPKLEESVRIHRQAGTDPGGHARALTTIGGAYADMGRLDLAESYLQRALELRRRNGDRLGEAVSLSFLHEVAVQRRDWAAARQFLLTALAVFRQEEHRPQTANTLKLLGWLDLTVEAPADAKERFEEALSLLAHDVDRRGEANALLGLGKALADLGRLREGLERVEESVRAVEEIRRKTAAWTLRTHHLAHRYGHHGVRIEILMRLHERHPDQGWDRKAFEALEQARAQGLLDELVRREVAKRSGAAGARRLAEEVRRLETKLEALENQRTRLLWDGAAPARLREIEDRMAEVELTWQRVEGRLREASRIAGSPKRFLTVPEVQRQVLSGEDLLLAYHLGTERSFLWIVGRDRFEVHHLPPREELAVLARRAHDLTADSRRRTRLIPARHALAALAEQVLAPVGDHLRPGTRLLVMADGSLLYAPFAALPLPTEGLPLATAHEIVHVPSVSALEALRRRRHQRGAAPEGTLALFADPVFGPADPRLTGERTPRSDPEVLRRSGESLERLDHSAREAASILALAPPGPQLTAFGFDATRERFLAGDVGNYRIVHLATHARVYADRPSASGIYFSRLDRNGASRVGILRSRDLYRMDLPVELVTLSACRTALGEELRGEGLVGFTQGFFAAGAGRVLVSLWDVGDESTALLMERFYQELFRNGRSPSAALRAAQVSMWEEEGWEAPYHWAGFILQGDPR